MNAACMKLIGVAALATLVQGGAAQPIVVSYSVGGLCAVSTHNAGDPINLTIDGDLGTDGIQPLSSVATLRIYDATRAGVLPVNNVGVVTIGGSVNAESSARLDVAVLWRPPPADPEAFCFSDPGFPTDPAARFLTNLGVTDFAGLSVSESLRPRTRLALGASGRIGGPDGNPGTISVGQVFRVQAGDPLSSTPTGVIAADITATGANGSVAVGQEAIGAIAAGDLISGNIIAGNTAISGDGFDVSTIGLIVVGPSLDARGIRGNIAADKGSINSILTTGPIGRLGTPTLAEIKPSITARNGVLEILASDQSTPGVTLAKTFVADVRTVPVAAVALADTNASVGEGVELKATLGIKTGGDYYGSITVQNLKHESTLGLGLTEGPKGIIIGGTMHGPITVVDGVWQASIAAASFEAPIVINTTLNGAVVATAPTGQISSLAIGTASGRALEPCHGFRDTKRKPVIQRAYAIDGDEDNPGWPDSLIAANSIGSLEISRMFCIKGDNRPRVEAATIQTLRIGDLRQGVVWSGIDAAPVSPATAPDGRQLSPYPFMTIGTVTTVGACEIGESGTGADLFLALGHPTGAIEIGGPVLGTNGGAANVGNLGGTLVMPEVGSAHVVRVRGRMLPRVSSQALTCAEFPSASPALAAGDGSPGSGAAGFATPRNARLLVDQIGSGGLGEGGAVRLMGTGQLVGQIVVNSSAVPDGSGAVRAAARGWFGPVAIRDKQPLRLEADPPSYDYLDVPNRLLLAPLDGRPLPPPGPTPLWNPGSFSTSREETNVPLPGGGEAPEGGAYGAASAALGGGAVGVVPYRIHREDSAPAYVAVPSSESVDNRLRDERSTPGRPFTMTLCDQFLRFYGPVYDSNPSGPGKVLRVHHANSQAALAGAGATDVTNDFTVTMGSTVMTNPEARRVYFLRQPTAPFVGWFRVQPNLDRLRCGLATTPQPISVADDTLDFFVAGCNPADIAQSDGSEGADGDVNNGDFQLFFASFFTPGCPTCTDPPISGAPCNAADIASSDASPGFDGCVNNGDFQLFFASFFNADCSTWCPPVGQQGEGEGGGEGMMSSMARAASAAGLDPAVVEQRLNALHNLGRPITPEDVRSAFPELLPGGGVGGGNSDQ